MSKTIRSGAAILALALTGATVELAAQQDGPRGPRIRAEMMERMGGGAGVAGAEGILRMRERLELTGEQVERLDRLRSEQVQERARQAAEVEELRSRVRAGTAERPETRERMRALRDERARASTRHREALESLLTDQQRATLEQIRSERRAYEAGRRSMVREMRGLRGQPPRRGAPRIDAPARGPAWRGAPARAPRPGFAPRRGGGDPAGVPQAPRGARGATTRAG